MKAITCISPLLVFCLTAGSQNLIGIWRGNRTQANGGCFPYYSMELHIYQWKEGQISGNAYSFYDTEQYTKINFTGTYNETSHLLDIIENTVLKYNIPAQCIPCIKTYQLKWSSNGNELLDGEWKGHEWGNNNTCPPGQIHLIKEAQPVFPVEMYQSDSLATQQRVMSLPAREKELVKDFHLDQSKVSISLVDNGDIDGDTVSIYLNNTLLMYRKALSKTPLLIDLELFPNIDYDLVVYAENEGTIPPNTSLLTITSGQKQYELRMSSNDRKSATVRFRYDQ